MRLGPCETQVQMGTNKKDIRPGGGAAGDGIPASVLRGDEVRPRRTLPFPWDDRPLPDPQSLSHALNTTAPTQQSLWQSQKLESLGLLAGGIAHDFNNYLLAIMGNADLLDKDLAEASAHRQLVTEIRTAAERAGDLCNQLLAFAGKGQFRIQPVDLSTTVRSMVRMLKVAISRKITLRLELDDELPLLEADVSQIHQVVMNLVVNASEAIGHRPGVVTVGTGVRPSSSFHFDQCVLAPRSGAGSFVYLSVTDTGMGMDPLTVTRAFDPFYTTKPQGRGLGLASVLGIVRSHRGSVGVDSSPGMGATVTVLFPRSEATRPQVIRQSGHPIGEGGGTILVVDDEEYLRVLTARMLTRLGYTVHLADSGPEAITACRRLGKEIDCVLLDLVMPGMDGEEVFEELRRIRPDLRILLTSGYHEVEVNRRFGDRGLAGFLQKPYELADLARKLNDVLSSGPRAARPSAD